MNTFKKELEKLIDANLPKAAGEALQKRLKQADELEVELKRTYASHETALKRLNEAREELGLYKGLTATESQLKEKERELNKKEANLEIKDLKNQLEVANEKTQFCKDVALGLVRNIEWRSDLFHSSNPGGGPTYDGQGNAHYPTDTVTQHSTTKQAE